MVNEQQFRGGTREADKCPLRTGDELPNEDLKMRECGVLGRKCAGSCDRNVCAQTSGGVS